MQKPKIKYSGAKVSMVWLDFHKVYNLGQCDLLRHILLPKHKWLYLDLHSWATFDIVELSGCYSGSAVVANVEIRLFQPTYLRADLADSIKNENIDSSKNTGQRHSNSCAYGYSINTYLYKIISFYHKCFRHKHWKNTEQIRLPNEHLGYRSSIWCADSCYIGAYVNKFWHMFIKNCGR